METKDVQELFPEALHTSEEIQKKDYVIPFSKGARAVAKGRPPKIMCQAQLKKLLSITAGYQTMPGPLKESCMQDQLNRIAKAYNEGAAMVRFLIGIHLPVGSKKAIEIIEDPAKHIWKDDFISEITFETKWKTLGPEEVSNGLVLEYASFTIYFRD